MHDFLPAPDELVKLTSSLTKESLEYFKKAAKAHHTQYQFAYCHVAYEKRKPHA